MVVNPDFQYTCTNLPLKGERNHKKALSYLKDINLHTKELKKILKSANK